MDIIHEFPTEMFSSPTVLTQNGSGPSEIPQIISDEIAAICYVVLKCAMYELFSLFGIITNTMSLIVFCKLGCGDTINVTLLGLTISDLASLIVLFWMGICYNPFFIYSDVNFDTLSIVYLSGGWPKIYFTRVTSWITAFVTMERCLCIAMPLKVKLIFTPKRSACIIISLFLVLGMMLPPIYFTTGLSAEWFEDRNKTLLGLAFTKYRDPVYNVVVATNLVLTYTSFFCVIVCTLILVVSLDKKRQWRKTATHPGVTGIPMTLKDQKVSKMVVMISAIFMGCLFPGTVLFLIMILIPEFNKGKAYHNFFTVAWAICHVFEATNASVNIFVYFKLSSNFKRVFMKTFGFSKRLLDSSVWDTTDDKTINGSSF